ncbi:MAG: LPP20 family lipoprotein [Acidobacteriota bacterium]|nr:LPP20 family lipoprotein [Acidobacteriota bacterium]
MRNLIKKVALLASLAIIAAGLACSTSVQPTLNPNWADLTLRAIGNGAPPAQAVNAAQSRLMAKQAAETDAYRKLAQQVSGVHISSDTLVQDFITKSDRISSDVQSFIKGARVISSKENPDGSFEVVLELFLGKRFEIIVMR